MHKMIQFYYMIIKFIKCFILEDCSTWHPSHSKGRELSLTKTRALITFVLEFSTLLQRVLIFWGFGYGRGTLSQKQTNTRGDCRGLHRHG